MEPIEPSPRPVLDPTRPPLGSTVRRSRDDRMLAGVCGGVGRAVGVDPALLRIGLVLLTVFGMGAGVVVYVAAWVLVPRD